MVHARIPEEAGEQRRGRSGGSRTLNTPGKSRVRCRCATDLSGEHPMQNAHEAGAVGREGLEPSPLGLKARCSANRASVPGREANNHV